MLLQSMKSEAGTDLEKMRSVIAVDEAEKKMQSGDFATVTEHLKTAGRWALEIEEKLGLAVAKEVILDSLGLKIPKT